MNAARVTITPPNLDEVSARFDQPRSRINVQPNFAGRPNDADTRHALVAWWGEAMATMEEISAIARRIAEHAETVGDPMHGLIDPDKLITVADSIYIMATELSNNTPMPSADFTDPTATLPELDTDDEPKPINLDSIFGTEAAAGRKDGAE